MKFTVRDGFVCTTEDEVAVGNGNYELRANSFYPGTTVSWDAERAAAHAHQVEPADDEARAWMASQYHVPYEPPPATLTPQQMQAITQSIVQQLLAATTAPIDSTKAQ